MLKSRDQASLSLRFLHSVLKIFLSRQGGGKSDGSETLRHVLNLGSCTYFVTLQRYFNSPHLSFFTYIVGVMTALARSSSKVCEGDNT